MRSLEYVLDLLLPDTCVLCGQIQRPRQRHKLCLLCWTNLPYNHSACAHCALPLASPGICGACLTTPLTRGRCVTPLGHEGDARRLVHEMKYAHNARAATTLAHAICAAVEATYDKQGRPACVMPVPLSYWRECWRGYNQATWLAAHLSHELCIPQIGHLVHRRHGPAQQTLPRRLRRRLSNNTFTLKGALPCKHIAIVDDVLTTGSTVSALIELLESAGAEQIDVWCATRAMID